MKFNFLNISKSLKRLNQIMFYHFVNTVHHPFITENTYGLYWLVCCQHRCLWHKQVFAAQQFHKAIAVQVEVQA
jgi:hypothetical protein